MLGKSKKKPNISYLCPEHNEPSGGIKVLYRHAEYLSQQGFDCSIYHPNDPTFRCDWFSHNVNFRSESYVFQPNRDHVVIPEIWAAAYHQRFREKGVPYSIFVQNGYLMDAGVIGPDQHLLDSAYYNAKVVASVSEDTTELITLAFPELTRDSVLRLYPDFPRFSYPSVEKNKTIAYMPRKLSRHSERLIFLMRPHLPKGWSFLPIDGKNESEVWSMLESSSIFLSFSEEEGFSLPPLEAAFAGNIVVGYTGRGAKEYFDEVIFRSVDHDDFNTFVKKLTRAMQDVEDGFLQSQVCKNQQDHLANNYSQEKAEKLLTNFAEAIKNK